MPLRAMDFESIASANSAKRPGNFATEGYANSDQRAIAAEAGLTPDALHVAKRLDNGQ